MFWGVVKYEMSSTEHDTVFETANCNSVANPAFRLDSYTKQPKTNFCFERNEVSWKFIYSWNWII